MGNILVESDIQPVAYKSIFYDRPVSNLRKKHIAILVGKNTNLFEIQQVYKIIEAMNHNPILIVDESFKELGLPADIYLSGSNRNHYHNTDQAIELIEGCNSLIAGIGLEVNSSLQLLIEKLLVNYSGLVVLTESTLKFPGIEKSFNRDTIVVGSTKKILSLEFDKKINITAYGLNRKIQLIQSLIIQYGCSAICAEEHQLISIGSNENKIGVINSKIFINSMSYLAILVSLLSDRDLPMIKGWIQYSMAAGYLYKNYFQKDKNPQLLKEFLLDQF